MSEQQDARAPTQDDRVDRIWCPDCNAYTARLVRQDEYGDEILHCRVCGLTWIHP